MQKVLLLLIAAVAMTGCKKAITIANEPAHVTSVGPVAVDDADNVVVPFTLRDLEGDDQNVRVEICDASKKNCGIAQEGFGSDPLQRMPTVPADTDVLHQFVWQPWCGYYLNEKLTAAKLDTKYVASIQLLATDAAPVYSDPFSLTDLGVTDAGTCQQ